MRARVSLQVERVVESFAAERAQIALDVRMAFHVPIEQSLQRKRLGADVAGELVRVVVGDRNRRFFAVVTASAATAQHMVERERILESVSAIDEFQLNLGGQSQLLVGKSSLVNIF